MTDQTVQFRFSGQTRASLSGKTPEAGRVNYLTNDDNSLLVGNGTNAPFEYPTKTKVSQAIAAALGIAFPNLTTLAKIGENAGAMTFSGAGVDGSSSAGNLISSPVITGNSSSPAGKNVILTAGSSAYLWGGTTGITYEWTVDGTVTTGATCTVTPAATVGGGVDVKCRALGANGTTSPVTNFTVTTIPNTAPVSTAVIATWSNATSNTRTVAYTATLSGGTDAEGIVTYRVAAVAGLTITSQPNASGTFVYTVSPSATVITIDATVIDDAGLSSTAKRITYPGSVVQPVQDSGVLTASQTLTVGPGVSSLTVDAKGGAGTAATSSTRSISGASITFPAPLSSLTSGAITFNVNIGACCSFAWYPGTFTIDLSTGNLTKAGFYGACGGTIAPTSRTATQITWNPGCATCSNFTLTLSGASMTGNVLGAAGYEDHITSVTYSSFGSAALPGAATTISESDVTLATFAGAATGVTSAPAITTQTITGLDPAIAHVLTVNIATGGGSARVRT